MNIVIIGAGNIGLAIASYIAIHKNDRVILFTDKNYECLFLKYENSLFDTSNFIVSNDVKFLLNGEYILCTYPAFLRKSFIDKYGQYIKKGAKLGFVPGYGGAEYACRKLIDRGVIVFGFQRVPYVARADKNKVNILSRKTELFISALPSSEIHDLANDVERMLDIPTHVLNDYLSVTLTPTNPIIHIAGLWGAFKNYNDNDGYKGKLGFYDQWDDDTSKLLFEYDREVQNICKELKMFDLSSVISLPIYYESETPENLTKKLKSIQAFKVVKVPVKKKNDKLVVDLQNRMFTEDFPYGVVVYKDIANILNLKTPTIDRLLRFYYELSGIRYDFLAKKGNIENTGAPSVNGLETREQLIEFYKK